MPVTGERRAAMSGTPVIFCSSCQALREIREWHDEGELLRIELDPCGHVMHRNASVEWMVHSSAA
jgi:hypothetical protein